ncbi:Lipoate-protein ligase A [Babesia sp. Xinjiang]|uniref:Lipoate-protein ligase A n=1 Tax=Babesia sp. Xinjiang TaxID=462227 RepID=UPI000A223F9C|nr:Lipoate-protein ligase A [Babesia sp. Xinjiang]ORM40523.1 Lipoate-protein ligase A [Babesia sp. Xinjiang]
MGALAFFRRCFSRGPYTSEKRLRVLISDEEDIYFNLALENTLLKSFGMVKDKDAAPDLPLLFLWRNTPCVIVGCNQNIWSECNLERVKRDGVKIVRRFTGGGAVYQDLGNTCFTFISPVSDYNFERNSNLICAAVGKLIGQLCEPSGRNDLCVNGLKFSGAAFKVLPNAALHHGTLLLDVNQGSLDKYLTPDKSKLEKHNVKSVGARVTNLSAFNPDISHEIVCNAIIEEVSAFYGEVMSDVEHLNASSPCCSSDGFKQLYNKLTDEKWIYGELASGFKSLKKRFDFGSVEICFDIRDGVVAKVLIFSDCMNGDFIAWVENRLNQAPLKFRAAEFSRALERLEYDGADFMLAAIKEWLVGTLLEEEKSAENS